MAFTAAKRKETEAEVTVRWQANRNYRAERAPSLLAIHLGNMARQLLAGNVEVAADFMEEAETQAGYMARRAA